MSAVAPLIDVGASSAKPSERDPTDFYETPPEFVEALLPHLPTARRVLDPAAGRGAILDVFRERWGSMTYGIEIVPELANAAREKNHAIWCGDTLNLVEKKTPLQIAEPKTTTELLVEADLITTNVPFFIAQAFGEVCNMHRQPSATVAIMARLSFIEAAERVHMHRTFPPDVFVIPNRYDFTRGKIRVCPKCNGTGETADVRAGGEVVKEKCAKCKGKTYVKGGNDSLCVAWFVYGPGRGGRIQWLDPIHPE